MKTLRRPALFVVTLLLAALFAACGGTNMDPNVGNGNMNDTTPMAKTTPMNDMGMKTATPMNNNNMGMKTPTATAMTNNNNTMANAITITPDQMGDMNAFIHTGKAMINGNSVNVLMTNKGYALYYYMPDPMLQSTCTGDCAKDWPPVLAPQGMMTITSSVTLPRQLSVHQTANGAQVFYDGHALYTYAEDMQPNVATGRGEDGAWYLVGFTL